MNIDWNLALTIAVGVVLGGLVFYLLMAVMADFSLLTPLLALAALVGIVWGGYYVFASDDQWAKDARWWALMIGALPAALVVFALIAWMIDKRPYFYVTEKPKEPKEPAQH